MQALQHARAASKYLDALRAAGESALQRWPREAVASTAAAHAVKHTYFGRSFAVVVALQGVQPLERRRLCSACCSSGQQDEGCGDRGVGRAEQEHEGRKTTRTLCTS